MSITFATEYIEQEIDLTNLANIFAEKIKSELMQDNAEKVA